MHRFASPIILAITLGASGCALFGPPPKGAAQHQAEIEASIAASQAQGAKAQAEADRQAAIARKQQALIAERLAATQYSLDCETLAVEVGKTFVELGRKSAGNESGILVSDWTYTAPEYRHDPHRGIVLVRESSRDRYMVELTAPAAGSCTAAAKRQWMVGGNEASTDRATDLEMRLLERVDPKQRAQLDADLAAIAGKGPATG